MMNHKNILLGSVAVILSTILLVGCGNQSTNKQSNQAEERNNTEEAVSSASNIPYLRENHARYHEYGSAQTPAPIKDPNSKSISWTIESESEEGAIKLQEHIIFMESRLKNNQNPRGWDKLFLMEAYMKYNGYYTTSVERNGRSVVVSKNANTVCAYEVISAHSDAVSGDFFARGDIMRDYSSRAEDILASGACSDVRSDLERYIAERQIQRGRGMGR